MMAPAFAGLVGISVATGELVPLKGLDVSRQSETIGRDLTALQRFREGLHGHLAFVESRPDLFPPARLGAERLLTAAQKEDLRSQWSGMLDYYLALDALGRYHADYRHVRDRHNRHGSFLVAYGCFLAQYRIALAFLARADNNPAIDKVLNEEMPRQGLPGGTYAQFKFRFLNVARATEFMALEVVYKARMNDPEEYASSQAFIREDAAAIWAQTGRGTRMTFRNAGRIVTRAGFTAYFPVQCGVADWMGETKVYRKNHTFISAEQIAGLVPRLRPGDILLTRREWHLSNIGLPGFWTHAMLYVGTAEERRRSLGDDPEVQRLVRERGVDSGAYEDWLARDYPQAYAAAMANDEDGSPPRILEAIGPGVVFRSLEEAAAADSLVALRPRRTPVDIAIALHRAFTFSGRPYDYNFDFQTDAALVCSEVVYKAYEPMNDYGGIAFPMVKVAGRFVLPPNEIARWFAEQVGAETAALDFVFFLDGDEKQRQAHETTLEAFVETWRRPKWRGLARRIGEALHN